MVSIWRMVGRRPGRPEVIPVRPVWVRICLGFLGFCWWGGRCLEGRNVEWGEVV